MQQKKIAWFCELDIKYGVYTLFCLKKKILSTYDIILKSFFKYLYW